jgi:hypothetical protein
MNLGELNIPGVLALQLFTDRERDQDTVHGGIGRTDPQTLNRYPYVRNNPVTLTDPSGLCPLGGGVVNSGYSGGAISVDTYDDGKPCPSSSGGGGSSSDFDFLLLGNGPGRGVVTLAEIDDLRGLFDPKPKPQTPTANATKTCSVSARLLQGNASKIGQPGGFSGNTPAKNVYVTANGAAVVPSQWGGKGALRPYLNQISGVFPKVGASFQGIVDVVGGTPPPGFPPHSDTGQDLIKLNPPGTVIIELPGAPKDYGTAPGTITMPNGAKCPG